MPEEPLLLMENISKSFVGVQALQDVSLTVKRGEAHALVGENGAGKSTLMKILSGIYAFDSGSIHLDGEQVRPHSALEAQKLGISIIHQELNMIPELSVRENIFLGRELKKRFGLVDWKRTHKEARELLARVGIPDIDITKPVRTFSTAIQQMISIARALSIQSKLVIMDEPTSSLDQDEVHVLFELIRKLQDDGISIIFISHRIDEIFKVCARVTILKDGQLEGTYHTDEITKVQMVSKMIGRDATALMEEKRADEAKVFSNSVCRLENASSEKVTEVDTEVLGGQIVGLAGLLGSGRTEIARMMFGLDRLTSGSLSVKGKKKVLKSPRDAIKNGFAFCPENRRADGIVGNMSVRENITLVLLPKLLKAGIVDEAKQKEIVNEYISLLNIKTPNMDQPIKYLSGGNQQKVILARWLCTHPELIILDEPTRGIDVGAKQEIEALIKKFAEQSISVVNISSEISELIRICDRLDVIRDGRKISELSGSEINQVNVLRYIAEGK